MKYISLLRGINVGGNNKVSMVALKQCYELLGFEHVRTYINSGNVLFESSDTDIKKLVDRCEAAIEKAFGFHVTCSVIAVNDLEEALVDAPDWWDNNPDEKHNAIFVIPPATTSDIIASVGETKPEYEKVAAIGSIIFWSAPLETFSRTRYSKIVGTDAYKSVTIRNANTTKKLAVLSR